VFFGRVAGLNYTGSYSVSSVFLTLLCKKKPVAPRGTLRLHSLFFATAVVIGRRSRLLCGKTFFIWLRFAMPLYKVFSTQRYSFRRLLLSLRLRVGCSASLDFIYFAPCVAFAPRVAHSMVFRGRKSHSQPLHLRSDRPATSKQAQKKHSFDFCLFCTCSGGIFLKSLCVRKKKVKKKKRYFFYKMDLFFKQ
jgi:hypothetical protein